MNENKEEKIAQAMGKIGSACGISTFFVLFAISVGAILSIPALLLWGPGVASVLGGISSFITYYGYFRILCRRKKFRAKEEGKSQVKGEVKSQIAEFIKSLPEIFRSIGCFSQLVTAALGVSLVASAVTYTPLKDIVKLKTKNAPIEKTIKTKEAGYSIETEPELEEEEEDVDEQEETEQEKGKYVIQVTLTNTMSRANRVVKKLERNGVDAYVAKVKDPAEIKGTKYRVRVGGFASIPEAKSYASAKIAPLGYGWYIDNKSNDHIGKPLGYKPPEQQPSDLPVLWRLEPPAPVQTQAQTPAVSEAVPAQPSRPVTLPEDPYAMNKSSQQTVLPITEPPAYKYGGGMGAPQLVGVGLAAAGIGAGIYGFLQNSKYDNYYNEFKTAKSPDEEKVHEQKAEDAKLRRNVGNAVGAALLASGIGIYVVF